MPVVTYPEDPDSWSESLNPAEGSWSAPVGEVSLDRMNKVVGEASIKIYSPWYTEGAWAFFKLHDGKEFDATLKNAKIKFFHALETNFTGECLVRLHDSAGNYAIREFGTAPTLVWEVKEFPLGPDTGWAIYGPFDWTHVKEILIICWEKILTAGSFWVDSLHFSYEVVRARLRIESLPTGKHFEIDGLGGLAPTEYLIEPGTPYTVSMDPIDFIKWEDGTTSPERTVTLGEGEVKTITAYYTIPPSVPPVAYLLPFLIPILLGTVIYATRGK